MNAKQIYAGLADKTLSAEEIAKEAMAHPELVQVLVDGMGEPKAEVKYGCAKVLRILTDEEPALLYPHFDTFAAMLDNPNNIFQWQALYVLAGLSGVDEELRIEPLLPDYFARIEGPVMVTAANAIKGAALIVSGQPALAEAVVEQVLRAEGGKYESTECHEIVCGQALKTFYKIRKWVSDPERLLAFAQRHADSPRPSTAKAAAKLIGRLEKERVGA
jgi:hypothetical protein